MQRLPKHKPFAGFSLVELMIVVSIMAVLAVIALTIYSDAQKTSRDARRKADMTAMASALEARYGSVTADKYPAVRDDWFAGGKPKEIGSLSYTGTPSAEVATFTVCAKLEKPTGNYCDAGTDYANDGCAAGTAEYFCVKNRQ